MLNGITCPNRVHIVSEAAECSTLFRIDPPQSAVRMNDKMLEKCQIPTHADLRNAELVEYGFKQVLLKYLGMFQKNQLRIHEQFAQVLVIVSIDFPRTPTGEPREIFKNILEKLNIFQF